MSPREIVGLPDWAKSDGYDIIAKPAPGSNPTREQRVEMIRNMLIERMKLVAHVEEQLRTTFALVVAHSDGRLGPNLKPSTLNCAAQTAPGAAPPPPSDSPAKRGRHFVIAVQEQLGLNLAGKDDGEDLRDRSSRATDTERGSRFQVQSSRLMTMIRGLPILLVLTALAPRADACSCMSSGPPCQNFFQVDAVFAGTVRTISETEGTQDPPSRRRLVVFTIDGAFRGVGGAAAEVTTGIGGGDCGYEFKQGQRYLVYAYRDKNTSRLTTSICSRTRPIAEAAEDLQFIQTMPASAGGASVYGTITHWERDLATGQGRNEGPVPFVHVLLRGTSGVTDAETDDHGRYSIAGVAPGAYEVQVMAPARFTSKYLQSKIEIRDARACAVADFSVQYDGRISGIVLNADGQPAAGVALEVMSADRVASTVPVETMTAKTGSGGYYEFSEVPPGRYVFGVNLRRTMRESGDMYPKTFYPGTSAASDAAVIDVADGNRLELEPFRLPAARRSREVTGVVLWLDGRPVSDANVWLADGEATFRQVAMGIKTDADGRFSFVVYDGLSYAVRVSDNIPDDPKHRQVNATSAPFVVSAETPALRLILTPPINR